MKKGLKVLIALVLLGGTFLLGWRVMPKVWPDIKENVVYPVFPQLQPTPAPTIPPYVPHSTAAWEDPIQDSDSVIYYFYKDYCGYCRELEPLTAGLPQQITLPDGTVSAVKFITLNKVEDKYLQIINAYYDEYDIPAERQYVPAIVIGDRYLYLKNEIVPQLMDALTAGEGLKTPLLDGSQRVTEN